MAVRITAIPATRQLYGSDDKRRAAAYARVSTDHEDQLSSCEAQVSYYTNFIRENKDLEFVNVYIDEGITGTSTTRRKGFKQMISDALSGKIDLIITKSVSRFARNTVDSLSTIRLLREHGVECFFEKENIRTFDGKGELMLTIMSSLAQEESRSISENCTWGQRKRFADGKVSVPFSRFLGYDRGADGGLIVNDEQAAVVRRIYKMFLEGNSPHGIARILTAERIPAPGGQRKWYGATVASILSNEKYKGDALLQKVFTVDYLTKTKRLNRGELPQYYIEEDHKPIIPEDIYEEVQKELDKRRFPDDDLSPAEIFTAKIICGECGGCYEPKILHSTNKYRKVIWKCPNKKCAPPHFIEAELKHIFIIAVNERISAEAAENCPLEEFSGELWNTLIHHITLYSKSDVRVFFTDGAVSTVNIENTNLSAFKEE